MRATKKEPLKGKFSSSNGLMWYDTATILQQKKYKYKTENVEKVNVMYEE